MSSDRVQELVRKSRELGDTPEKVALLEEAVRIADSINDEEAGFNSRIQLIDAAEWSGLDERAVVAFSWCLAYWDRNNEDSIVSNYQLLWRYKWIICDIADNLRIDLGKLEEMLDDFERRYRENGSSIRTVHYMRWTNYQEIGLPELTEKYFELWLQEPRDYLSDCHACELNKKVKYKLLTGQPEEAFELVQPILEKRLTCKSIPKGTYSYLLRPAVMMGNNQYAAELQRTGYRAVSRDPAFSNHFCEHMLYFVQIGNPRRALELFRKHFASCYQYDVANRTNKNTLLTFIAGAAVMQTNAAERTRKQIKLLLPREIECFREDHKYDLQELADWFQQKTDDLAARFDKRHGNDYFARCVENRTAYAAFET